jgi:hypothetical protein
MEWDCLQSKLLVLLIRLLVPIISQHRVGDSTKEDGENVVHFLTWLFRSPRRRLRLVLARLRSLVWLSLTRLRRLFP